jgi:hypothetical protein
MILYIATVPRPTVSTICDASHSSSVHAYALSHLALFRVLYMVSRVKVTYAVSRTFRVTKGRVCASTSCERGTVCGVT